jgi:peroxiredoxin
MSLKVGDKLPSSLVCIVKYEDEEGFSNEIVDTNEYFENKNIVLIGYPGAFAPTDMLEFVP